MRNPIKLINRIKLNFVLKKSIDNFLLSGVRSGSEGKSSNASIKARRSMLALLYALQEAGLIPHEMKEPEQGENQSDSFIEKDVTIPTFDVCVRYCTSSLLMPCHGNTCYNSLTSSHPKCFSERSRS